MSNELRPKHTFIFWLAMAVFAYGLISLAIATATLDKCGSTGPKHWGYLPPGWICGA